MRFRSGLKENRISEKSKRWRNTQKKEREKKVVKEEGKESCKRGVKRAREMRDKRKEGCKKGIKKAREIEGK